MKKRGKTHCKKVDLGNPNAWRGFTQRRETEEAKLPDKKNGSDAIKLRPGGGRDTEKRRMYCKEGA